MAQSALNPSSVILDFPMIVLSFMSTATTNLISREADREAAVTRVLRLSYTLAALAGAALFLFHSLGAPSVLRALGTPAATAVEALRYISVRSLFSPFLLISSVSMASFLALRDPRTPLRWALAGAATNCAGDLLLCTIFPLGIAGAAWATVASQAVVLTGLLGALHRRRLLPRLWPPPPLPLLAPFASFAGPVSALSAVRVAGFVALAAHAGSLSDPNALAAHQISVSILVLLSIAGEPLNAAGQTQLPRLYPGGATPNPAAAAALISTLVRAAACVGVASCLLGGAALLGGGKLLAASPEVNLQLRAIVAPYCTCLALTATAVVLDGSLVARKDFGFLVPLQLAALAALLAGLAACRAYLPQLGLAAIWVAYLGYLLVRLIAFSLRLRLGVLRT